MNPSYSVGRASAPMSFRYVIGDQQGGGRGENLENDQHEQYYRRKVSSGCEAASPPASVFTSGRAGRRTDYGSNENKVVNLSRGTQPFSPINLNTSDCNEGKVEELGDSFPLITNENPNHWSSACDREIGFGVPARLSCDRKQAPLFAPSSTFKSNLSDHGDQMDFYGLRSQANSITNVATPCVDVHSINASSGPHVTPLTTATTSNKLSSAPVSAPTESFSPSSASSFQQPRYRMSAPPPIVIPESFHSKDYCQKLYQGPLLPELDRYDHRGRKPSSKSRGPPGSRRPRGRPKGSVRLGRPKRPLSAYNLFFRDEREKILKSKVQQQQPLPQVPLEESREEQESDETNQLVNDGSVIAAEAMKASEKEAINKTEDTPIKVARGEKESSPHRNATCKKSCSSRNCSVMTGGKQTSEKDISGKLLATDTTQRDDEVHPVQIEARNGNKLSTVETSSSQHLPSFSTSSNTETRKKRGRPRGPNYSAKKTPHGKIKFEELAKIIAPKWKNIDPDTLERYQAIARREKERYMREVEVYEAREEVQARAADVKKKGEKSEDFCELHQGLDDPLIAPSSLVSERRDKGDTVRCFQDGQSKSAQCLKASNEDTWQSHNAYSQIPRQTFESNQDLRKEQLRQQEHWYPDQYWQHSQPNSHIHSHYQETNFDGQIRQQEHDHAIVQSSKSATNNPLSSQSLHNPKHHGNDDDEKQPMDGNILPSSSDYSPLRKYSLQSALPAMQT